MNNTDQEHYVQRMARVNVTAQDYYAPQDAGVGVGASALEVLEKATGEKVSTAHRCLEIGCAGGDLLRALKSRGCQKVIGVEIVPMAKEQCADCTDELYICDVSHSAEYVTGEDCIDFAFCTETIEHLTNPYFMFANVKRMLKHNGYFVLSFPDPSDNLGTEGGQHAHVYPHFLMKESFELFARQLYFRVRHYHQNGASAWYVLQNVKQGGKMVDVFEMIAGNYNSDAIYGWIDKQ